MLCSNVGGSGVGIGTKVMEVKLQTEQIFYNTKREDGQHGTMMRAYSVYLYTSPDFLFYGSANLYAWRKRTASSCHGYP